MTTPQGEALESLRIDDLPEVRPAAPPLASSLRQSPALAYLARLDSDHSRRTMRRALEILADWASGGRLDALGLPWHTLRYPETSALRSRLVRTYSPAGARLRLAALRGVLREAWRLGLMDREALARATDLEPIRGERRSPGRALSPQELAALVRCCRADVRPAGKRDLAILVLLATTGMRRSELSRLKLADWHPELQAFRVLRKGNREDRCYLPREATPALADWLALREDGPGSLFLPLATSGKPLPGPLTPGAIRAICKRRAQEAGLRHFSPHDLRRTYATLALEGGADLRAVQLAMGHRQVGTTETYDLRGDRARASASSTVGVALRDVL